ncbi:MAG TPA: hypothetical protein VF234_06965 [Limnochordia bacterium]
MAHESAEGTFLIRLAVMGGALLVGIGVGMLLGERSAWTYIGLGAGLVLQGFVPRG